MKSYICAYSIENAQLIQAGGGRLTRIGTLWIEYIAPTLIVGEEIVEAEYVNA